MTYSSTSKGSEKPAKPRPDFPLVRPRHWQMGKEDSREAPLLRQVG